jgi:hypothetical protein
MPTYVEILRAVHDSGADYAWIGLTAAALHGSPLVSYDFDFFVRPDSAHLEKVRGALRQLGLNDSLAAVHSANVVTMQATVNFTDPLGGPPVDLLTRISGPSFEEVWRGSVLREFAGITIRVASLEHIIASKQAANRPKDREAIERLKQEFQDLLDQQPPSP